MRALIFLSAALVATLVVALWRQVQVTPKTPGDGTRARLIAWMALATLAEVGAVAVMLERG